MACAADNFLANRSRNSPVSALILIPQQVNRSMIL
jgi:hypothetical protein